MSYRGPSVSAGVQLEDTLGLWDLCTCCRPLACLFLCALFLIVLGCLSWGRDLPASPLEHPVGVACGKEISGSDTGMLNCPGISREWCSWTASRVASWEFLLALQCVSGLK